jgi:hypothetical protein
MNYWSMATLFEGTDISQGNAVYSPGNVISAVRSHNVLRVNRSYEPFGDRFTTTIVDDLATSDLSQAVKGL